MSELPTTLVRDTVVSADIKKPYLSRPTVLAIPMHAIKKVEVEILRKHDGKECLRLNYYYLDKTDDSIEFDSFEALAAWAGAQSDFGTDWWAAVKKLSESVNTDAPMLA